MKDQTCAFNQTRIRPFGGFCLLAGALVFLQTQHLPAPSGTWLNTSGNWSDSSKWAGGVIADGAGFLADTTALGPNTTRTITLDTDRTIGFLNFRPNDPGVSNRVYVLVGPGVLTLSYPGQAPGPNSGPRINVRDGYSVVRAVIAGNEGLACANLGHLVLTATNTYTGSTMLYRCRLLVQNPEALPHGSRTGDIYLNRGGNPGDFPQLDIWDLDITINGLNSIMTNLPPFSEALPRVTTLAMDTPGTSTLTVGDNNANGVFEGEIVDGPVRTLALTKIGSGTQVLGGPNTYTGPTTVNAGALIINSNLYSPVTVNGGLLGGNGTLYNSVVVNAGGTISAGASVGVLHLIGGLDLSAGGTNLWELVANSESNPGVDFDQIELAAGTLDLSDSTLVVSLGGSVNPADPFWTSPRSWDVITSASGSGTSNFKYVKTQGAVPSGTFTTTNDGMNVKLLFTPGAAPPQPPPTPVRITAITGAGTSSVTVHYTNTIPGSNYVLQAANSLNAPVSWVNIVTNQATGTTGSGVDNTAGGQPQRYYRVFYRYSP